MNNNELVLTDVQIVESNDEKDIIEEFLEDLDNVNDQTIATYRNGLKQYVAWLNATGRSGTTRDDVKSFKRDMSKGYTLNGVDIPKKTASTVSSYMTAVRLFYKYVASEYHKPNLADGIQGEKRPHGFRKDRLSVDQTRKVLNTMKTETLDEKRNYAIVQCLARLGLRTVEIVRADVGDIHEKTVQEIDADGTIKEYDIHVIAIQGKGRTEKDEELILTDATYGPIVEYLNARGPVEDTDPLFASGSNRNKGKRLDTRTIRTIGKKAMVDAGIINNQNTHRLTTHSYRHGAVSMAVKTSGIESARNLARHQSVATTMIYWHTDDRYNHNAPEFKIDKLLDGQ